MKQNALAAGPCQLSAAVTFSPGAGGYSVTLRGRIGEYDAAAKLHGGLEAGRLTEFREQARREFPRSCWLRNKILRGILETLRQPAARIARFPVQSDPMASPHFDSDRLPIPATDSNN